MILINLILCIVLKFFLISQIPFLRFCLNTTQRFSYYHIFLSIPFSLITLSLSWYIAVNLFIPDPTPIAILIFASLHNMFLPISPESKIILIPETKTRLLESQSTICHCKWQMHLRTLFLRNSFFSFANFFLFICYFFPLFFLSFLFISQQ